MPNGAPVLVLIPNAAPQQAPSTMTTIPATTRSHDMVTLPLRDLASSSFCAQDL